MKRLSIICLSLTLGCMSLLGLISARAAGNENAVPPSRAITAPSLALLMEVSPRSAPGNTARPGSAAPVTLPVDSLPEDLIPEEAPPEEIIPEESFARAPVMALTFDDGPCADYTPLLLDGLLERGVRATFFMVGLRAEKEPDIVRRVYEEGHVIGGHSYDHINRLPKLSNGELSRQVDETAAIIAAITGAEEPLLLRPPYGAINEDTAKRTGKAIMMWNIDPRDWDVRNAEKVCDHIVEHAMDGGVVILHDIVATTAAGVFQAIDVLQAQGWRFVTLPELYADFGIKLTPGGIYRGPEAYILPAGDR